MRDRMLKTWTLGGLPIWELIRRTARESWEDEVFGQASRMAFYHFLAIFPSLLVFLTLSARIPHLGDAMKNALRDVSSQVLPGGVAQLFQRMMDELGKHAHSDVRLLSVGAGAVWAALNGTWAMVYGLNHAYEVEERRSWWKLTVTIVGLTLSLALTGSIAVFLIFASASLQTYLPQSPIAIHAAVWLVVIVALSVSFSLLYRFAPNLRDHEWRWSTPGAVCALILWVASTFAAREWFDHVNNYARSYGELNGAVMLLLWLYVTNGAILVGGEMNSEIEKAATAGPDDTDRKARHADRSGGK